MSGARPPRVPLDEQKRARAALTYLAEPGDPALGALLAARFGLVMLSAFYGSAVIPGR
jgi:hypothetical protein